MRLAVGSSRLLFRAGMMSKRPRNPARKSADHGTLFLREQRTYRERHENHPGSAGSDSDRETDD